MGDTVNLTEEFSSLCYSLDEQVIVEMSNNNSDVGLNNVITGLNDECYGLILNNEPEKISYQLFYVNGKNGLTGFLIDLDLDNPKRDDLVFMFATHLTHNYHDLDLIDAFNTFQHQTRSMLEKEGHFTVSSLEMEKISGKNPTIIAKGVKGILLIPLIDKVQFLQGYFGNRHTKQLVENENYIYLMLNTRNGLIKIGTSNKPFFRERTLQSDEPEVKLLTLWTAPKEIEKELHKMFSDKRRRGEWFDLKPKDIKAIKDKMIDFE